MSDVEDLRSRPSSTEGTLRDALGHRQLRWLLAHHAVGGIGQTFATVAVGVVLFEQTGSAGWVAAAAAARLAPYLCLAGVAGTLADRMDRRQLLLRSSLVRAGLLVALALAVATSAPPAATVLLVFAVTAFGTGSFPAVMAMLPRSVPSTDLAAASTLLNAVETAAWLVGPAIGGLALIGAPPVTVLAINVGLFLLATTLIVPTPPQPVERTDVGRTNVRHDLRHGLAELISRPAARASLVLVVAVNVAVGAGPVVMLLATERFSDAGGAYGTLVLATGLGGLAGVLGANLIVRHAPRAGLELAAVAGLVPFLALAPSRLGMPALVVAMAVGGAGAVATEVATLTKLLRALPEQVAGRVFGLVDSLLVASVLVGAVVAPLVASVGGAGLLVVVLALALPVAAVAGARVAHAGGRGARRRRQAMAPDAAASAV